jgi:ketosteroid isomerase-like protein
VGLTHREIFEQYLSLVQIFRLRDGRIARLRDYFAEPARG